MKGPRSKRDEPTAANEGEGKQHVDGTLSSSSSKKQKLEHGLDADIVAATTRPKSKKQSSV